MKTTNLTFIEALQYLLDNPCSKIRRNHWHPRTYCFFRNQELLLHAYNNSEEYYIVEKDAYATNWEAIIPEPKLLSFADAIQQVKYGKKIRRRQWDNSGWSPDTYLAFDTPLEDVPIRNPVLKKYNKDSVFGTAFPLSLSELQATDWYVFEEPKETTEPAVPPETADTKKRVCKREMKYRWNESKDVSISCEKCGHRYLAFKHSSEYGLLYLCDKCHNVGTVPRIW